MVARFEVQYVFEVTGRGRVIAGTIRSGELRSGDRLSGRHTPGLAFTISAVEYVDHRDTRECFIGLVSTDAPALSELGAALPAGSILVAKRPGAGLPEVPHVA